ncbi:MAG: hypothetical protein LBE98_03260 [Puniceicoccales bacterium]|jgi:hypothetical protein|nr:hypothetical protein [Puniceicoccales bacterium]
MKAEYTEKLEIMRMYMHWDERLSEEENKKNGEKYFNAVDFLCASSDPEILEDLIDFFTNENDKYGGVLEDLTSGILNNYTLKQISIALCKKLDSFSKKNVERCAYICKWFLWKNEFEIFRSIFNMTRPIKARALLDEMMDLGKRYKNHMVILSNDIKSWELSSESSQLNWLSIFDSASSQNFNNANLKPGFQDGREAYHILPGEFGKKYGIRTGDGLAIILTTEQYRKAKTIRRLPTDNSPRDELARNLIDVRRILKEDEIYTPKVNRNLLKSVKNHELKYPYVFGKGEKAIQDKYKKHLGKMYEYFNNYNNCSKFSDIDSSQREYDDVFLPNMEALAATKDTEVLEHLMDFFDEEFDYEVNEACEYLKAEIGANYTLDQIIEVFYKKFDKVAENYLSMCVEMSMWCIRNRQIDENHWDIIENKCKIGAVGAWSDFSLCKYASMWHMNSDDHWIRFREMFNTLRSRHSRKFLEELKTWFDRGKEYGLEWSDEEKHRVYTLEEDMKKW